MTKPEHTDTLSEPDHLTTARGTLSCFIARVRVLIDQFLAAWEEELMILTFRVLAWATANLPELLNRDGRRPRRAAKSASLPTDRRIKASIYFIDVFESPASPGVRSFDVTARRTRRSS